VVGVRTIVIQGLSGQKHETLSENMTQVVESLPNNWKAIRYIFKTEKKKPIHIGSYITFDVNLKTMFFFFP
jgi:hypothetical protein